VRRDFRWLAQLGALDSRVRGNDEKRFDLNGNRYSADSRRPKRDKGLTALLTVGLIGALRRRGLVRAGLLASYLHFPLAQRPELAMRLIDQMRVFATGRQIHG